MRKWPERANEQMGRLLGKVGEFLSFPSFGILGGQLNTVKRVDGVGPEACASWVVYVLGTHTNSGRQGCWAGSRLGGWQPSIWVERYLSQPACRQK